KPVVNHLMEVFNELVESIQVKQDTEVVVDRIVMQECLDKVLRGFETQIEEYGAEIRLDLHRAPILYFPQKYMESILTNLISNALKYKSPDRKPIITIKTRREAHNIVLLT